MPDYVAYYRVSTDRQGVSGLGLEAQRSAVIRFIGTGQLLTEFQEVESGKNHANRPKLAAALEECRRRRATLVIAKLDRLARNVHFVSGLMESNVDFVALDMPQANKLVIHVMAAFAEHEREAISQRTKAALAEVKRRGEKKLGNPRWQESLGAARTARQITSLPPELVQQIMQHRVDGWTLRRIAGHLEATGVRTPRSKRWHPETVRAILSRISLPESIGLAEKAYRGGVLGSS